METKGRQGCVNVPTTVPCFVLDSRQIPLFPPLAKGEQGGFAGKLLDDCYPRKISAEHANLTGPWKGCAAVGPGCKAPAKRMPRRTSARRRQPCEGQRRSRARMERRCRLKGSRCKEGGYPTNEAYSPCAAVRREAPDAADGPNGTERSPGRVQMQGVRRGGCRGVLLHVAGGRKEATQQMGPDETERLLKRVQVQGRRLPDE